MTAPIGIYIHHPDDCPHAGFGLLVAIDNDVFCEGCGQQVEIAGDHDIPTHNPNPNSVKEIN